MALVLTELAISSRIQENKDKSIVSPAVIKWGGYLEKLTALFKQVGNKIIHQLPVKNTGTCVQNISIVFDFLSKYKILIKIKSGYNK